MVKIIWQTLKYIVTNMFAAENKRPPLTKAKAAEVKEAVRGVMGYNHTAQAVRLAFHDCVGM